VKITKDSTVGEVIKANPKAAEVFQQMGMKCLGCPSASSETVANAAEIHGMDLHRLLEELQSVGMGEMSQETRAMAQPHGAVLQRDKQTYAIVPHIPGGITDPQTLRKIADVAEKYQAAALKVTSAQRIAIVGLKPEDVESAWSELGMDPGAAVGLCLRSVKICPGTTFCKRGQQDSVSLGLEIDKRYHGRDLPSKTKIAVSGCQNSCSEPAVRDIGIMGTPRGFTIMVGGNAGLRPRLGDILVEHREPQEVLDIVDRILEYFQQNGKRNERIGRMIDRIGLETLRAAVLTGDYETSAETVQH
jgi:hybrid cluster-associated redox disulfide protein